MLDTVDTTAMSQLPHRLLPQISLDYRSSVLGYDIPPPFLLLFLFLLLFSLSPKQEQDGSTDPYA